MITKLNVERGLLPANKKTKIKDGKNDNGVEEREEYIYCSHKIICFEIIFASPCLLLALGCPLIDSFFARALLLDLCL